MIFICESSSAGRASRCQREGREFESRLSLTKLNPTSVGFFVCYKISKSRSYLIKIF